MRFAKSSRTCSLLVRSQHLVYKPSVDDCVYLCDLCCSPITYSWEGGKLISENDDFEDMVVTREDYEENGHSVCEEKFDI